MDIWIMLAMVSTGALITFMHSQRKFRDRVLCIMHTQQGIRLEIWAPLDARHIKYGSKKKGDVGMYQLIPAYASNTWYDKGINKLFPSLVKTWEFWWFCPYPQDPMSIHRWDEAKQRIVPAISWHTPEVRNAAWQEHQYRAFTTASAQASGAGGSANLSMVQKVTMLGGLGLSILALGLIWKSGLLVL